MTTENAPERHRLWDQLPPLDGPSTLQLEGVWRKLRQQEARGRRLRWTAVSTVLLGALLAIGTAVRMSSVSADAAGGSRGQVRFEPRTAPAPVPGVAPAPAAPAAAQGAPTLPARRAGPIERAAERSGARSAPHPPVGGVAPAPEGEPQAEDAEAALLGRAIMQLRRQGDAAGALATLAEYRQTFPAGALQAEVTLVRAEALLREDRQAELLEELTPEKLARMPRAAELSLLRAEALVRLDRCDEAAAAIDVAQKLAPDLGERAQALRARCRSSSEAPTAP